uniref:Uncharacterized protein n=1 Tax=Toxoplasma gondii (strain ATCC 50861 / VEG) TaxID=432359 RepID=A0A0F7V5B5_TOXGV|nr:TPA: hypothetical protein BN1205_099950 [Toxoplasma gondii VEG]
MPRSLSELSKWWLWLSPTNVGRLDRRCVSRDKLTEGVFNATNSTHVIFCSFHLCVSAFVFLPVAVCNPLQSQSTNCLGWRLSSERTRTVSAYYLLQTGRSGD